jgi:methyl-accepting chemotaxis protein
LEAQVDQLVRNNQDLDASLNDTSYQLRYLIRHVESQNGTLPAEVPPPNNLLGDAHIPPTISHDKIVFKDITELQERNQELLTEIRHLTTQLKEKTIEAQSNADTAKEQHDLLNDTTTKSTALIRDQNEKIQALELRYE